MQQGNTFEHHQRTDEIIKTLWFVMIDPNGNMYNENKTGPNMEPCGTPEDKGAGEEMFPIPTCYKFCPVIFFFFGSPVFCTSQHIYVYYYVYSWSFYHNLFYINVYFVVQFIIISQYTFGTLTVLASIILWLNNL